MKARLGLALAASAMAGVAGADIGSATGLQPDRRVAPGDDFYQYANGVWLGQTSLPDGMTKIDTMSLLRTQSVRRVQAIIDDAVAGKISGQDARRIADYYTAQRDGAAVDAHGLISVAGELAEIAGLADRRALAAYLGRVTRLDDGGNQRTESLWGVWVHQGFHDPASYAAHLVQGGLRLDDADYLDVSADAGGRTNEHRGHIARQLEWAGRDRVKARAARVFALETAIARTHTPRAHTDDVFKIGNLWHRADFIARAPGFDWDAYFAGAGLAGARDFIVWQPEAVTGGARLAATEDLAVWRDYLTVRLLDHYASVLPGAARDVDTARAATTRALGDAIGRIYVARHFPPQAKRDAEAMAVNIRAAFQQRIAQARWMSPETRARAQAKLASLRLGLGYPGSWVDYAPLTVMPDDAFGNLRRVEAFAYRRETVKLSQPVDPDEWPGQFLPQAPGAVLQLSPNTMQFSAAILQPPFFGTDRATNYGSAGAGLAHEVSHSFDEVGNIYDPQGRLGHWWHAGDATRYRAQLAPLEAQLRQCCPTPATCTNAGQILSETAADLLGLSIAYDGYVRSLHGRRDMVKGGLTGEQRFFIAFAQRWRRVQAPAAFAAQVASDNHAAPQCRGNLVRNHDAWARAFNVRAGQKLYVSPAERVRLW